MSNEKEIGMTLDSMSDVQYIYTVNVREFGGSVLVGIYDPERWEGKGGARFGFTANVDVQETLFNDGYVAGVSIGGIGSHSPDEAALRIDVYQQAADIARFINDQVAKGETMESIGAFLTDALKPGEPVTGGFKLGA